MALIRCNFKSELLDLNTSMTVILPDGGKPFANRRHPTLYLLHGLSDDDTIWLRRTSIERYVENLNLAVVMPQVHRSFYTDMAHGNQYWSFLTQELPRVARSFFPLSDAREDNFVAGLSMGGYGALKWALSKPEEIAAAASLSGAVDAASMKSHIPEEFSTIFGDQSIEGSDYDLFHLLDKMNRYEGPKPRLFQCCGTEDFLYKDNQKFLKACEKAQLDYHYEESPGDHNWAYWDQHIQSVLRWIVEGAGVI